jgi:DNA primase
MEGTEKLGEMEFAFSNRRRIVCLRPENAAAWPPYPANNGAKMVSSADFDNKEQVRQANDIENVVGSYLELRRQGSNFVALCPWHDDNRPSLQVNPARQTWKCWPCDIGGDVFSFVQQREGVGFGEALKILADRAGIELQTFDRKPLPSGSPGDKQTLFQAMAWAQAQFFDCLNSDPTSINVKRYLAARGINDACIEHFRIGYAPDSWSWLTDRARNTPYSEAVLEACGLLAKNQSGKTYQRFRGRVMFPIHDLQDRVVAFGGRILPEIAEQIENQTDRPAAKYINSPETRLFSKSETLYGLNHFRGEIAKEKHLVVVEGYTDVIAAWKAGLNNVVAVLGTALNERHIRLIKRYADRITLVLDGDQAGVKRANEILELFVSAEVDLRILTLPEQMDPFDYLQQNDAGSFREMVDSASDALDHKIQVETAGIDLIRDTHNSNRALENILSVLARSPNRTSTARVRNEQLLTRLAHLFQIDHADIQQRHGQIKNARKQRPPRQDVEKPQTALTKLDWKERELLQILCEDFSLLDRIVENISPEQFVNGPARDAFELYCDCFHSGRDAKFQNILTMAEDIQLKNLLVELDEEAHCKKEVTDFEIAKRLDDVLHDFKIMNIQSASMQTKSRLASNSLDDQEETSTLEELLEIAKQKDLLKRRQGLSAPTDG